ncbi:hypothetical protein ACLB2K_039484 [Fragaria x ananassa]
MWRGVRQGDPLSPLLFCLAEEVLSIGLADLATRNKIKCFKAPGGVTPPTHVLFADDVMIFTQGRSKYLRNLMSFMKEYAQNSGQAVNTAKSQLFLGKSAIPRQMRITNILGINESLQWIVGDGELIHLWKDNWLGDTLVKSVNFAPEILPFLNDKVCTFIHNREWRIPWSFKRAHQVVAEVISSLPLPAFDMSDQPVWAMETSGILTARSAYCMLAEDLPVVNWGCKIWHAAIQPRKSLVTWKVLLNRIPTDEFLQRRG